MPELTGEIYGEAPGARVFHVGIFPGPRIQGQPVAWTSLTAPGPFRLTVPGGTWHIHAVSGPTDQDGFLSGTAAGSYGGIYGYGAPVAMGPIPPPYLRIHVSPLWRDLTHVPRAHQPPLPDHQQQVVRDIQDALSANLDATVERDLERAAGLGRTRLSALFRRATGLTVEEYRIRIRLEAAKALLVVSNLDVTGVALEVGYGSPAQFGRMFQRYLAVTPTEFRRQARIVQSGNWAAAARRQGPGALLQHALLRLRSRGATLRGEVTYGGLHRGPIIYLGAFPGPLPTTYPSAWLRLPGPGPFTLRGVPAGRHFILACYCHKRMRYPGDFYTAFAYGGYGYGDLSGRTPWAPVPIHVHDSEERHRMTIPLVDGDLAAASAGSWSRTFLPDGR